MTTTAGVGFSSETVSSEAGAVAARDAMKKLNAPDADIMFVFAATSHEYARLLPAIRNVAGAARIVGCSAAGEFTHEAMGNSAVAVMAIKSDSVRFAIGLGRGLKTNRNNAVGQAMRSYSAEYRAARNAGFSYATNIVLSDGLAGHGEDIVEEVHAAAGGVGQVVGGAAADDAKFVRTDVFLDEQHYTDSVVVVHAFSKENIGIGVRHGLVPACPSMIVTRATGSVLHEIDGRPALAAYEKFAQAHGDPFMPDTRDSFMMTHEVGMLTPTGEYKVRAPLRGLEDGSILMASEVPVGASIAIMAGTEEKLVSAAESAARSALTNLGQAKPGAVIAFDCICRRIFLGEKYRRQVDAFRGVIGENIPLIGWETYGEIALTPGQQSGWHNSTSVLAILPN
jgi:hypothetical protein